MKKIITHEIYPSDLLGKEMVVTQMNHHYRRLASAKPRVDTNLSRHQSPRPLSAEATRAINRHYRGDACPPKHRVCSKYASENSGTLFRPTIYSTSAESKLKERCEIYHPPVKSSRIRKSKEEVSEIEKCSTKIEEQVQAAETLEKSVQTLRIFNFRPLHKRSVKFLKDVTDEALARGAQTNIALERIFRSHQERNKYRLPLELIDRELDMLRRELRMPLASRRSSDSYVSDEEALRALDRLALKPETKREVIATLSEIQIIIEKNERLAEKGKSPIHGESVGEHPKQMLPDEPVSTFLLRKSSLITPIQSKTSNSESMKDEKSKANTNSTESNYSRNPRDECHNCDTEETCNVKEDEISEASTSSKKSSNQDLTDEQAVVQGSLNTADFTTSSSQHLSVRNMSQLEALQEFDEVEPVDPEADAEGNNQGASSPKFEDDVEAEDKEEEVKTDEGVENAYTDSEIESLRESGGSVSSVHTE